MTPAGRAVGAAWARWEKSRRSAGDQYLAGRMEATCAALAVELGVTTTALRVHLSGHRRDGLTISDAISRVTEG